MACVAAFSASAVAFASAVCGMPDYDQRRDAATLMGDGRSITVGPGLTRNGACHAVAANMTNLLGWFRSRGAEGDYPGVLDWAARPAYRARPGVPADQYLDGQAIAPGEVDAYNRTTTALQVLGDGLTARCGTRFAALPDGDDLDTVLRKARFSVAAVATGDEAPRRVAGVLAAGGGAVLAYGRYPVYRETGGVAAFGARKGGHLVTVHRSEGRGTTAQVSIHDPARTLDPAEAAGEDLFRQSLFTSEATPLTRILDRRRRVRWRYGPVTPGGSARIVDAVLAVVPTTVVLGAASQVTLVSGLAPPVVVRTGGPLRDAAFLPATGEVAYLRAGDRLVRAVTVGTGVVRVLGRAPRRAVALEASPTGSHVFAGGERHLVRYETLTAGPERRVTVPGGVRALAFDAWRNRLAVITAAGRRHWVSRGALRVGPAQQLPRKVGGGALGVAVDRRGRLVLRLGVAGLAIGDEETTFTLKDGRVRESTAAGKRVTATPLAGARGTGRLLAVTRSGNDVPAPLRRKLADERWADPEFPEMAP